MRLTLPLSAGRPLLVSVLAPSGQGKGPFHDRRGRTPAGARRPYADGDDGELRMKHPGLLVALILAVGVAGAVVALKSREGNAQFVAQQQDLLPVNSSALERLILTTSDPRPGYGGRARGVRCASTAGGALRNPWTCVVRYPRLPARALRRDRRRRPLDSGIRPARRPSAERLAQPQRVLRRRPVGSELSSAQLSSARSRARRAACARPR